MAVAAVVSNSGRAPGLTASVHPPAARRIATGTPHRRVSRCVINRSPQLGRERATFRIANGARSLSVVLLLHDERGPVSARFAPSEAAQCEPFRDELHQHVTGAPTARTELPHRVSRAYGR